MSGLFSFCLGTIYVMTRRISRRALAYYLLFAASAFFVLASTLLGKGLGMYETIWWWDDMLHILSGVLLVLLGLAMMPFVIQRHSLKLSPFFVVAFVFFFATTVEVAWEIFEFTIDGLFATSWQRWDHAPSAVAMGWPYQGPGLRDTMTDLILGEIGALLAVVAVYLHLRTR